MQTANFVCQNPIFMRSVRNAVVFHYNNNGSFSSRYYPSGVQILTGGSDRKVAYWEVLDGSLVRELEGSPTGTINTLDISPDGEYFATGGNDQIIKLWRYQEGIQEQINFFK